MRTIWRLLSYLKPYPGWLALSNLSMLGLVLMSFAIPWLTRYVIDVAIIEGEWHLLLPLALGVVAAGILHGMMFFVRRYSSALIGQLVIFDLRNQLYRHLHELPFSFYDRSRTGELMSRVTQDVETMRRFLAFGLVNLVRSILMSVGVLTFLMFINWRLTMVVLITLPPLLFTIRAFATRVRPMYRRVQEELAGLTSVLQENIAGLRVIRSFAREEYEIEKFEAGHRGYLEQNLGAVRRWAFFFPLMNMITGMGTVLILWYGGREVIAGNMSLGWLVAFNQYLALLLGPLRMLGWLVNLTERASASATRVFELLDTESDIVERPGAIDLPRARGHVEFEDVWFEYAASGDPVLRGVSFEARPGETVAILGATGSGKSTVMNLIPRFYDPHRGRITLDGHDLRDLTIESLRRNIGMVMQETFLFSAPIAENVAYGRPGATSEEIEAAAKAAQIHELIAGLPDGYDTVVGERGVGLSGGQKQRVAIARALLLNPPILILDDSTSSVDAETEHLIQEALERVMKGRTSFIIAQRLSSVRSADQVFVLDRGRIVQRGTHETLIGVPGIYREIHQLQSADSVEISEEIFERARLKAIEGMRNIPGGRI